MQGSNTGASCVSDGVCLFFPSISSFSDQANGRHRVCVAAKWVGQGHLSVSPFLFSCFFSTALLA